MLTEVVPQVLPYRAHPMPMSPMKPVYAYPAPTPPRNGVLPMQEPEARAAETQGVNEEIGQRDSGDSEIVSEEQREGNISSEPSDL